MSKNFVGFLVYGFLSFLVSFSASANSSAPKVCVLIFERSDSPITNAVVDVFKNARDVSVKVMAAPLDILGCVQERATEIVIVGHALETPASASGKVPVNLAYFRDVVGAERQEDLVHTIALTKQQIASMQQTIDADNEQASKYGFRYYEDQAHKVEMQQDTLKRNLNLYENFPENQPYLVVRPVLPQAFRLAHEELERQARTYGGVALRKIRLMSCIPQEILAEYDDLREMISENSLALDIAPANSFMSWVEGQTVTSPDPSWLQQSIPR